MHLYWENSISPFSSEGNLICFCDPKEGCLLPNIKKTILLPKERNISPKVKRIILLPRIRKSHILLNGKFVNGYFTFQD